LQQKAIENELSSKNAVPRPVTNRFVELFMAIDHNSPQVDVEGYPEQKLHLCEMLADIHNQYPSLALKKS